MPSTDKSKPYYAQSHTPHALPPCGDSVYADFGALAADYVADEGQSVARLIARLDLSDSDRSAITATAETLVHDIRKDTQDSALIDAFLQEYGLSSAEGVALMRLAEALIRTPDFANARTLIRDKLAMGAWHQHSWASRTALVNSATEGLRLSAAWIKNSGGVVAVNVAAKLGDHVMAAAVKQAMSLMGEHFVLGVSIAEACARAALDERDGFTHSYDMLGEAAHTQADAARYFAAYANAVDYLVASAAVGARSAYPTIGAAPGISVKLSALHPRYIYAQHAHCIPMLTSCLRALALRAKAGNIGLAIDAEECDRLETSLVIFRNLLCDEALAGWDGLGLVVQAYQRRAPAVLDWVIRAARNAPHNARRRITIRLVKGAYWDSEIKRAQELGLASYPVFTRKENTDVSYLACAQQLLAARDVIYPQFATHNAHSAAAILHMARIADKTMERNSTAKPFAESLDQPIAEPSFEFQRLHGMGAALHRRITAASGARCRIYAPVGAHKDLLPYLVRRLLENGANSSFVNQLLDVNIAVENITRDPIALAEKQESRANPKIPSPRDIFNGTRLSAQGLDITQHRLAQYAEESARGGHHTAQRVACSIIAGQLCGSTTGSIAEAGEAGEDKIAPNAIDSRQENQENCVESHRESHARDIMRQHRLPVAIYNPANHGQQIGRAYFATRQDVDAAFHSAAQSSWGKAGNFLPPQRATILCKAADLLEKEMADFIALCVQEAGKTLPDAIAEIREAVDFCRYYAQQALQPAMATRTPLGTVVAIAPWNFPLAIFIGQVTAALAAGNQVLAKPAEQTPLIGFAAVQLLHRAGVPLDALHLLLGAGDIGAYASAHADTVGICFTGSTSVGKKIALQLAESPSKSESTKAETILIAETGGINAMIIDSTALLEQAVQDVIDSAFYSAGQRCSACRLVCVQEDIAEDFTIMLAGAVAELRLGDPAVIASDVGPVIDRAAYDDMTSYIADMRQRYTVIAEGESASESGYFIRPTAFAVPDVHALSREVFGPILHMVTFCSTGLEDLIAQINHLGFGLTMGLHTRIDARVEAIAAQAKVGNLYINRNQVGAVVGVQPFGGEGLSGTGPKAGGPHYLLRLSRKPASKQQAGNSAVKRTPTTMRPMQPMAVGGKDDKLISPDKLISSAREAQKSWAGQSVEYRRDTLRRCAEALNIAVESDIFKSDLRAVDRVLSTTELPGPTGETNQLRLVPRGILLCFGGDSTAVTARQLLRILACGSAAITAHTHPLSAPCNAALEGTSAALGNSSGLLSLVDRATLWDLVAQDIDGVVADGTQRLDIAPKLARRAGAILPLLSVEEEDVRFFHERILTINTTAAGGNASLLAMSS